MATQVSDAVALMAAVLRAAGWRFAAIVGLTAAAAGLESAALLALPILFRAGAGDKGIFVFHFSLGAIGLPGLLAGYVGVVALNATLLYVRTMLSTRLALAYGESLRTNLHEAAMRAGWGAPALARPADLVHALGAETGQCAYAVNIALNAATRLLYLPPLLTAAAFLSPGLTVAAAAFAVVAGLPMIAFNRRTYRLADAMARAARALNAEIADQMAGLRVLKILRAEALRGQEFRRRVASAREAQLAQASATALVSGGQKVAAAAAVAAGGYWGLAALHLEAGALIALVLVFARLSANLAAMLDFWRQLARLLPVHRQLAARLDDCRRAAEPRAAASAPRLERALRFQGVGFTHPGASSPALSDVDLVLPALSVTALVGPSGAGKSTLADLIMGLTAPTQGRIFVDDLSLEGASRVAWRGRVAYVPQDPYLFHDTIGANLRLARPEASNADLRQALDRAAGGFALDLPDGLDTLVGDRGARLSGGERQRIVLARALLTDPDLVVLDEATNALDAETERRVVETLRGLIGRTTILVIAHGGAAMALANRVVRLEAGRVVDPRDEA